MATDSPATVPGPAQETTRGTGEDMDAGEGAGPRPFDRAAMCEATGTLAPEVGDGWMADPIAMSRGSRRAFRGLIRALCPPEPQVPNMVDRVEAAARQFMAYMNPVMGRGLVLAMRVLDWAPVWRLRGLRRLQSLDHERAAGILDALGRSRFGPLRMFVMAMRAMVLPHFFDLPEIHAALDYDPVTFIRGRIEVRARLLTGAEPTAADGIGPHSDEILEVSR